MAHILSRGPPTTCHHCSQTLTIDHMLLEYAVLQESRDEYYIADSLNTLFETIPDTCIVVFLREARFFYLIWTIRHSIQSLVWTIPKLMQFLNIMNTTQLTPWGLFMRRSLRLACLEFLREAGYFIWYEWPYIQYNSLFKSVTNWRNSQLSNTTRLCL